MLVSPSDFSTCPIGRVLWEELLVLSRFRRLEEFLSPDCGYSKEPSQ